MMCSSSYSTNNNRVVLATCLALIAIYCASSMVVAATPVSDLQAYDLPPPPPKPEKFTSKQQLKDYLIKLHEYYAIIGRPRFGRSFPMAAARSAPSSLNTLLFSNGDDAANSNEYDFSSGIPANWVLELIDENKDGVTSRDEIYNFLRAFQKN